VIAPIQNDVSNRLNGFLWTQAASSYFRDVACQRPYGDSALLPVALSISRARLDLRRVVGDRARQRHGAA
jgi:hypothetical protein